MASKVALAELKEELEARDEAEARSGNQAWLCRRLQAAIFAFSLRVWAQVAPQIDSKRPRSRMRIATRVFAMCSRFATSGAIRRQLEGN